MYFYENLLKEVSIKNPNKHKTNDSLFSSTNEANSDNVFECFEITFLKFLFARENWVSLAALG